MASSVSAQLTLKTLWVRWNHTGDEAAQQLRPFDPKCAAASVIVCQVFSLLTWSTVTLSAESYNDPKPIEVKPFHWTQKALEQLLRAAATLEKNLCESCPCFGC